MTINDNEDASVFFLTERVLPLCCANPNSKTRRNSSLVWRSRNEHRTIE